MQRWARTTAIGAREGTKKTTLRRYAALGPLDAGYVLAGGAAAWLETAAAFGAAARPTGWTDRFLAAEEGVVVRAADGRGAPLPFRAAGLPAADDWDRLAQLDADTFFLSRLPIGAALPASPREARATKDVPLLL